MSIISRVSSSVEPRRVKQASIALCHALNTQNHHRCDWYSMSAYPRYEKADSAVGHLDTRLIQKSYRFSDRYSSNGLQIKVYFGGELRSNWRNGLDAVFSFFFHHCCSTTLVTFAAYLSGLHSEHMAFWVRVAYALGEPAQFGSELVF